VASELNDGYSVAQADNSRRHRAAAETAVIAYWLEADAWTVDRRLFCLEKGISHEQAFV
jgi:hypothetical protein